MNIFSTAYVESKQQVAAMIRVNVPSLSLDQFSEKLASELEWVDRPWCVVLEQTQIAPRSVGCIKAAGRNAPSAELALASTPESGRLRAGGPCGMKVGTIATR